MHGSNTIFPILKKNKIAITAIAVFLLATASVFAFAADKSATETETAIPEEETVDISSDIPSSEETLLKEGCGIYIDGYFVLSVGSAEEGANEVDKALSAYMLSLNIAPDTRSSFTNDIEFILGEYPPESFVSDTEMHLSYKVTDYNGELLPVNLSVTSVKTVIENVVLEHEVKTVYTDSMKDGIEKVINKGFDGEAKQTTEIISVNGVETERNVVALDVITPSVSELVYVGTRSDGMHMASVAKFLKPYDGIISSYMGPRWGTMHNGLDICQNGGCFKDPAYAACGGVVINARDSGNGYGKCVIIDHGNGLTTLYAHLNSFSVEVGDIVEAGDEIGLIGSTGYSLAPHLHFEVRIDNVPVNPLMFVDYSDCEE